MPAVGKHYDKAYFDRWYRGRGRVHSAGEVRRKVALSVAVAEYFLRRSIRSVLDIGCGEGAWLPHLRAIRPKVAYTGVDPSSYAVERFGVSRNIRRAAFAELPSLRFDRHFDLIVCSDVLHYVGESDIRAGVGEIARILGGIAFIEVLTREDDIIGDLEGLTRRPAEWYRRLLTSAGFVQVAPYCWLGRSLGPFAAALEVP
jgi:SAM-dependent methyltransferase